MSGNDSNGINPPAEAVTLQIGTFTTTIPPGSFTKRPDGSFAFVGVVNGVGLGALIKPTGTLRYSFQAKAKGANLAGTKKRRPLRHHAGDGAHLDGPAGGGGALRLCHQCCRRHCLGDRHRHDPPSVAATIPVGDGPFGVAVTPDGKHVYVTNFGTPPLFR